MTEQDARLGDFGGKPRKPTLHLDAVVKMNVPGKGRLTVGRRGPVPAREEYGVLQYKQRSEHRLRKLDAYAMDAAVLTRLRKYGCKCVIIVEQDTDDVYEFHVSQFDEQLAKRYNPNHENQAQFYAECNHARAIYENHASDALMEVSSL